jgi:Ammonium Transporter Family
MICSSFSDVLVRRTDIAPCHKSFSSSGLIAVTGSCGMVDHSATVFIGLVAGWVYMIVEADLIKLKNDDAVSAIRVHMGNGLWGMLAVGLFASSDRFFAAWRKDSHPGWVYALFEKNLLAAPLVALFVVAWTLVTMLSTVLHRSPSSRVASSERTRRTCRCVAVFLHWHILKKKVQQVMKNFAWRHSNSDSKRRKAKTVQIRSGDEPE